MIVSEDDDVWVATLSLELVTMDLLPWSLRIWLLEDCTVSLGGSTVDDGSDLSTVLVCSFFMTLFCALFRSFGWLDAGNKDGSPPP